METKHRTAHTLLFVATSIVLSAILHVGALVWLSSVTFEFAKLKGAPRRPDRDITLQDVKKSAPERARPTQGQGAGRGGEDGGELGAFKRDYDPKLIHPEAVGDANISGSESALLRHAQQKDRSAWQPRQELIDISSKLLGSDIVEENRRMIPEIARVKAAPDIVYPVDYSKVGRETALGPIGGALGDPADRKAVPLAPPIRKEPKVDIPVGDIGGISKVLDDQERAARKVKPLDDFLSAKLSMYAPFLDSENSYFRLELSRKGEDILPVLPKDIIFVQDSSASMAEQRLHFCRDAIVESLNLVGKEDRFNIVSFSDKPVFCFDDWVKPSKSSFEKGKRYASNLRSAGNTDILASMGALRDVKVEEGRPCIALLVTDGLATTGIVESAAIIREFTKANSRGVSVFTMGTRSDANMYLLDMLSYCNGGSTHVVKGGRWSIAEDFTNQVRSVSRPVLSNLRLAFAGSGVEVFPSKVRHLYMDDPLVLYGRIPKRMQRVTFQAIGAAGGQKCDMIFDLSIARDSRKGGKEIRADWALQKAYHLVGEISRTDTEADRAALRKLAKEYRLKIPYADKI